QATCPHCQKEVEMSEAKPAKKTGSTILSFLCTHCKGEFDVQRSLPDVKQTSTYSNRFEAGRNFCNKLWNSARFALMNLGEQGFAPLDVSALAAEDRWIIS